MVFVLSGRCVRFCVIVFVWVPWLVGDCCVDVVVLLLSDDVELVVLSVFVNDLFLLRFLCWLSPGYNSKAICEG